MESNFAENEKHRGMLIACIFMLQDFENNGKSSQEIVAIALSVSDILQKVNTSMALTSAVIKKCEGE